MSEDIVNIEEANIGSLLDKAHVMYPAVCIGANVAVGPNPSLVVDDDVATLELLILVPTEGQDELAIMPIIMTPELAEGLGLSETTVLLEDTE